MPIQEEQRYLIAGTTSLRASASGRCVLCTPDMRKESFCMQVPHGNEETVTNTENYGLVEYEELPAWAVIAPQ